MSNPHRKARRLIRAHQRAERGPLLTALGVVLPLLAAFLVMPLFQPVFLHFLGKDPDGEGLFGVLVRLVLVLVGVAAIDTYGALIRSDGRGILGLLPVDAGEVAIEELRDLVRARAWLPVAAAILLLPLVPTLGWGVWAASGALAVGAWLCGLTVSAAVHLLAISAAENPSFAGILDLLRGSNPREQAAFLWAPGLALALASLPAALAAEGVRRMALGDAAAAASVALPPLVAVLALGRVPRLARSGWFRATAVLADIDARYAMVEEQEEATAAYMDWLVRFLPEGAGRYALKDLRHGWRARRSWISAMWGVGIVAGLAAWSGDPAAPTRGLALAVIGIWLTAAIGVILERDEPPFLRIWLPQHPTAQRSARWLVLFAWLQPAVWVPSAVVALRHDLSEAAVFFGATLLAAGLASAVSLGCSLLRERGLLAYGPVAAVAAAVFTLLATGGLS